METVRLFNSSERVDRVLALFDNAIEEMLTDVAPNVRYAINNSRRHSFSRIVHFGTPISRDALNISTFETRPSFQTYKDNVLAVLQGEFPDYTAHFELWQTSTTGEKVSGVYITVQFNKK